ncbi:uncharacterized protein Bfra_010933 [Botrytis fragariae]|uniref:Uncharacterized protein n=1 Tax=Botrytis fragariae TaxID=1964551 RepID=A0A8H6EF05_9HELO|nr:uncharacterized protein Bfra_010933 [Botrytis fragariae]KAF5869733.1 hypothetical protein Bfra_010933 [Botrytis fragariae]
MAFAPKPFCATVMILLPGARFRWPSLVVRMNQPWHFDEWKANRAYSQMPELRILAADGMWNSGLAQPFGPSDKPPKRRRRNLKAETIQTPPVRRSDRIKSMETKQYLDDWINAKKMLSFKTLLYKGAVDFGFRVASYNVPL